MILYDLSLTLAVPLEPEISDKEKSEEAYAKIGKNFNAAFKKTVFMPQLSVHMYSVERDKISIVMAMRAEENPDTVCRLIQKKVEEVLEVSVSVGGFTEITVEKFRTFLSEADNNSYIRSERRIMQDLKLNFEDNCTFGFEEQIVPAPKLGLSEAKKRAKELLVSADYQEELERIYSKENVRHFFEHPVHYHMIAENERTAQAMTDLLINALLKNKRLLGRRISRVLDLKEHCYNEQDFENLIRNSQGATVILPMYFGEEKRRAEQNQYEEAISYIGKLVRLYHKKVLFIFQEITSKECVARSMLAEIEEELRIIRIPEGVGCRKQAEAVLYKLISESEYASLLDTEEKIEVPDRDSYTMSDIYRFYDDWVREVLYHKAYKAYGRKEKVEVACGETKSDAYMELQDMVGLEEIKSLVDQMIAMHKLQRKRKALGMDKQCKSLHMIFTGNPGSAKTTVARLLASILYNEGIIKNKKIVECGRGDLVGKYVGWTAKQVQKKFSEAKGGVLFIDEAYSLVDEKGGSFGDEAINTIVQEMENKRDEVIVIFAGYPGKMEEFLNKNEGLRSRIAFHLDFPDYSETELVEILRYMVKESGFQCDRDVYEKCGEIFRKAVLKEDFGNGRYVRNLMEQAILRQSRRLVAGCTGKELDAGEINRLTAEDFVAPYSGSERKKKVIGFA